MPHAFNATPLRIAMWSGPRNISTAMMRSFENRPDTAVVDEPLYAHFLHHTGVDHPGAAEVIAADETDWHAVTDRLLGSITFHVMELLAGCSQRGLLSESARSARKI